MPVSGSKKLIIASGDVSFTAAFNFRTLAQYAGIFRMIPAVVEGRLTFR